MVTSVEKLVAKKTTKKSEIGFEEALWDAANKLRGSVESAEYKHIVLSLIFLKFISDKFQVRKVAIEKEYGAEYVDMVDPFSIVARKACTFSSKTEFMPHRAGKLVPI